MRLGRISEILQYGVVSVAAVPSLVLRAGRRHIVRNVRLLALHVGATVPIHTVRRPHHDLRRLDDDRGGRLGAEHRREHSSRVTVRLVLFCAS